MMNRWIMTAAAAGAVLLSVSVSAYGQSNYVVPKAAWEGHADLQGIWQAKNTANDDLEKHKAAQGIAAGNSFIVDPKDGKIPYLPAALAKRKANFEKRATEDSVNHCFMPGVPRLAYLPYPIQIIQTPKYIVIVSEYAHVYRTIYTDGSKHLEGLDYWNGDSRGHWEGDTLVVDVTAFNDQTWLDKSGDYHSDQLHVVERYTRTAPDILTYEATIEDPKVYSKPWKISMPLHLDKAPNARLMEYECQDLV